MTLLRRLIFTLPLVFATGVQAASSVPPAGASRKPVTAVKMARPPATKAAPAPLPQDDQSYLFATDPRSGKGPPDYVTSGSKHSNQPWFMTIYDTTGWN